MIKNRTIKQFEIALTSRVLCNKLIDRKNHTLREAFSLEELLTQAVYTANDIFQEDGIIDELRAYRRGNKVLILCKRTYRVLAELAVVADKTKNNMLKRPLFVLLDRRGLIKEQTIADLLIKSEQIRRYQRFRNRQNTNQIRYIEKAKQFTKKGAKR